MDPNRRKGSNVAIDKMVREVYRHKCRYVTIQSPGGKSAASSSRFAANSRASRNTATGPRVSTLDSRPRRFRRQQRSQSTSLPPFPRERRIRTPGASLKPAGAGPGPDDEVITISDDDSDDTYTVTSKVEDPRRRQRPSNDISNSQRRSSASTSSSAIDVSGAAPATGGYNQTLVTTTDTIHTQIPSCNS